jgi:hypothetical protein
LHREYLTDSKETLAVYEVVGTKIKIIIVIDISTETKGAFDNFKLPQSQQFICKKRDSRPTDLSDEHRQVENLSDEHRQVEKEKVIFQNTVSLFSLS